VEDGVIFFGGHVMSHLEQALHVIADSGGERTVDAFRRKIPVRWVEQALQATGTATVRKRRMPADQTLWLVLGMALMRDLPISEVVTRLELVLPDSAESKTIAKSSVSEARKRLGHEPVKWLFTKTAQRWADAAARQDSFRGLSVYAVDGSSMRIADTPSNRAWRIRKPARQARWLGAFSREP
jgi:hypothetical protein